MDEATRKRLKSIERSVDMAPIDLLRMAIDDIERGEIDPDGLVIVWCRRPADGPWDAGTYRANLPRDAELVQLELAKRRCLDTWLGS